MRTTIRVVVLAVLTDSLTNTMEILLQAADIERLLPHRYPFLLVDRVLEIEPGKRLVAMKNVTMNEHFFVGHFPGNPVMPGVLILEALAQAGGLLALHGREVLENTYLLFAGIDKARFRSPVIPGDTLTLTLEVMRLRKSMAHMRGVASVGDRVAAEAEILSMIGEGPGPSRAAETWVSKG